MSHNSAYYTGQLQIIHLHNLQCCCSWPWDVLEDKFWVLGLEAQVLG